MIDPTRLLATLLLSGALLLHPALPGSVDSGVAYAQSGDDGDDGGDGDDGDDDGGTGGGAGGGPGDDGGAGGDDDADGGGGASAGDGDNDDGATTRGEGRGPGLFDRLFGTRETPRRSAAPRSVPPPFAADREIVVAGLSAADLDRLNGEGYALLSDLTTRSGERVVRLRIPSGLSLDEAIRRIGELVPAAAADRNHYYRPQRDGACTADICARWSQIAWTTGTGTCAGDVTIGVVDTGINPDHDVFAGRRLELLTLREPDARPSERKHGTAVAALLVGAPDSRVPGLLPDVRLVAADPFTRAGRDERVDAFGLVAALDAIAAAGADVANLSLSGPDNRVLARRVAGLIGEGVPIVAAVGNGGPRAEPLFPAAYPGVIGVTAVDAAGRLYRRALRGEQVDFAAPGVDLPTAASISGVRPQTGTSFAVPFVTAAVALVRATRPDATPAEIEAVLAASARDLGEAGRDDLFGHGLIQIGDGCAAGAVAAE